MVTPMLTIVFAANAAWQVNWATATPVQEVPLLAVPAKVVVTQADRKRLSLPMATVVHQWLIVDGQQVQAGQPVVKLSGADLASLQSRLELAEHHAKAAKDRLVRNQSRYDTGDITRQTWMEWHHDAHTSDLEYQQLLAIQGQLQLWQGKAEGRDWVLSAPTDGVVQINGVSGAHLAAGSQILELLPANRQRLSFALPDHLSAMTVHIDKCITDVALGGGQSDGLRRQWLSAPLAPECRQPPGRYLEVTPWMAVNAYRIPRQSLFQWQAGDAVVVKTESGFAAEPVTVLSDDGQWLYVQGELTGKQLASASVAALKGMLMGMGGEQ
ncbi:hypothetical protein [Gallaecimonas sp. GXIMD1310]|uniref:hypothetical protein n=1 Tax=Gallaecimonas sp. GXIMD1310 TaxID=3131926 RepID=UPI0032565AAF